MIRVPWLRAQVRQADGGGVEGVDLECLKCFARTSAPVTDGDAWVGRAALAFQHAEDCPVPAALRRAGAARWN